MSGHPTRKAWGLSCTENKDHIQSEFCVPDCMCFVFLFKWEHLSHQFSNILYILLASWQDSWYLAAPVQGKDPHQFAVTFLHTKSSACYQVRDVYKSQIERFC